MKKLIVVLLNFCLFSALYGQSINLQKAAQFEYEGHLKTINPDKKTDYQYTYQFKTLGKQEDNILLECKLVRFRMVNQYNSGVTTNYNTDSIKKAKINSPDAFLHLAILQVPLKVTLSPTNQILKIEGINEAIDDAAIKWGLSTDLKKFISQLALGTPISDINRMFFNLPAQKLHYGYEWKGADSSYHKVTAINGAFLYINSSGKPFDSKTESTDLIVFNETTGLTKQIKSQQQYEVILNGNKTLVPVTSSYQLNLNYDLSKYSVDTAWINMAIKTNPFYSVAFKNKSGGDDSVKLFTYFKAHDAAFRNDPTYMVNKLDLAQQVLMTPNNYPQYHNMLLQIPTRYLKDSPIQLHNKIGDMLPLSVDSAYEISKYLLKKNELKGWMQESFAQNLISSSGKELTENEDFKKHLKEKGITADSVRKIIARIKQERTNAVRLLTQFHADKDPLMRQHTDALYLWVEAKNHDQDGVFLVKSGNKLMQMNDLYMHRGNGGRYALLIYKLLVQAHKSIEANVLLQKTINRLSGYVADTLNINRYADQNILAYAWYLRYTAAKAKDSVKALQYLSLAAQNSPKNNNEKAYTSFYDQYFLGSKESYREEFFKALFNSGNNEEALKIFAEHINAEPESLDEMQKTYQSYFPEKNFKQFFTNNIISTWKTAPDFTLKGINGLEKSIKDFKGSWLAIDFWGTWCPPCRKEMPDINAFDGELKEGKHSGITFLSIACRDSEENVKSFFAENNYNLPAVMSNRTVEQQYGINEYPSKILVSPNGKMLTLKNGDDWKAIVKKFNSLYINQ
ncbi:MAG: TlpA family protein disulfide reductase [Sphingobacteriaceae bacterium]|nr:MAG: TlpA family protein disulfide reductase [Sphingobacteriaceae bacterium]